MPFTGFGTDASRFLTAIAANNSREFFNAHRDEYVASIRQPLEDLLGEAEAIYGPGRVMRPNRDVRFSADKTPYRTNASMWAGDVGGVYLSLTADELEVGGGIYEPSRDQLVRARESIDSVPLAASQLSSIVKTLNRAGFAMAGPFLKTAPRGFDTDHPDIDLLRLKHFAALKPMPVASSPDEIRTAWKAVEPLNEWARTYVKAAESRL